VTQTPDRTVVRIGGGSGSSYERQYGRAYFCSLDAEADEQHPCPPPDSRTLRTVGQLTEVAESRNTEDTAPKSRPTPRYRICGERRCLDIAPVPELRDVLYATFPFWTRQTIEIVGAFGAGERMLPTTGPSSSSQSSGALNVWEASLVPERKLRGGASDFGLEALVRSPAVWAGRIVTVEGRFRGANLFEDLPSESRRDAGDWVLQEGPFSVWVTGKPPRGEGFALDSTSRADCRYRLRVEGTVETSKGYVYLKARAVLLLGRASLEGGA
jgi:hypothetical protein